MAEENSPDPNVRVVCETHAPKPVRKLTRLRDAELLNGFVKLPFYVGLNAEGIGNTYEHMWVKVTGRKEDGKLYGILNNQPVLYKKHKLDDEVVIVKSLIEDYLPPKGEESNAIREIKDGVQGDQQGGGS